MTISNYDDMIDSRDVIERIAELQEAIETADPADTEMRDELNDELSPLLALAEEASGSPDWQHGETLIRDSYFKEYAMDLAEDIGAINGNAAWPNNCIDWDQAARELRMDYFSVDFDGVDYWIRS